VLPALAALMVLPAAVFLIHRHLRMNPVLRGSLLIIPVTTTDMTTPGWAVPLRRGRTLFTVSATNDGKAGRGTARPIRTKNGEKALQILYSRNGSENWKSTHVLQVPKGERSRLGAWSSRCNSRPPHRRFNGYDRTQGQPSQLQSGVACL
jgi:hypothetical protein